MIEIKQYNQARLKLEHLFYGLPHEASSLIKSLITIANPATGMVTGLTWHDVSKLLEVTKKPGRKNAGIPSKDQTREYVNTILQQCGEDFKMATVGQKLQFQFPNMPAIYAKYITTEKHPTVINTDCPTVLGLENTGLNDDLAALPTMEVPTELTTPDMCVKNINNKNNIKNKQTTTHEEVSRKKLIAKNFYPSLETIAEAHEMGFLNVEDKALIKDFINKNTAWGSQFADFNPVYLRFLTKDAERKEEAKQITTDRSYNNERSSHKANSFDVLLADVKRSNPQRTSPSGEETFEHSSTEDIFDTPTHSMALGTDGDDLRPAFCHEIWNGGQTGYVA